MEFAFAVVSEFGSRLKKIFSPCKQFLFADGEGADIVPARLEDGHHYGFHIIDPVVGIQGSESVAHHLRVILRFDQNPKTIFEINNLKDLVRYDETVAGAEAVRYPFGEIQSLFNKDQRILAVLSGFFVLFHNKGTVFIRRVRHFRIKEIQIFCWVLNLFA